MRPKHRFSQVFEDERINQTVREIEDNFAAKGDLVDRPTIKATVYGSAPNVKDMADQEIRIVNDGSNQYFYIRIGGKLYRAALTEVT